jgi:hypothetical protein
MYDFEAFLDDPAGIKQAKAPKPTIVMDEREELIAHPYEYIRRKVRLQVNDCLWYYFNLVCTLNIIITIIIIIIIIIIMYFHKA